MQKLSIKLNQFTDQAYKLLDSNYDLAQALAMGLAWGVVIAQVLIQFSK